MSVRSAIAIARAITVPRRTSVKPSSANVSTGCAPGRNGSAVAVASVPTRPNQPAALPDARTPMRPMRPMRPGQSSTATSSEILVATTASESSAVSNPFREASKGLTFRSSA